MQAVAVVVVVVVVVTVVVTYLRTSGRDDLGSSKEFNMNCVPNRETIGHRCVETRPDMFMRSSCNRVAQLSYFMSKQEIFLLLNFQAGKSVSKIGLIRIRCPIDFHLMSRKCLKEVEWFGSHAEPGDRPDLSEIQYQYLLYIL